MLLQGAPAFSSFSVDRLEPAMQFYGATLGLEVTTMDMEGTDLLQLHVSGTNPILVCTRSRITPPRRSPSSTSASPMSRLRCGR
jgi:catechol-2,3-dioxygenase